MAGELERAVREQVVGILGAEIVATPEWLVRPGKLECRAHWQLVHRIYAHLTDGMLLPEHFNGYRARTLAHYVSGVPLAFPAQHWIERSTQKTRLEGGGWGRPMPPPFPGHGGRHRQRAIRDALCDIVPTQHGFEPTLRIGDFEVAGWINSPESLSRMEALLSSRLA